MVNLLNMQPITLTEDYKNIARDFANKRDVGIYLKRAKITEEKARNDVYQGCLAEFAVYEALKSRGCTKPDIAIYENSKKRYTPDLRLADGTRVHVKCQSEEQGKKYGISWIFEDRDSGVHKVRKGIVAFCVLNNDDTISIHKIVSLQQLHDDNLFKQTKLKFTGKKAIYAEDLKNVEERIA
jgi:hypothetical protein